MMYDTQRFAKTIALTLRIWETKQPQGKRKLYDFVPHTDDWGPIHLVQCSLNSQIPCLNIDLQQVKLDR